MTQYGPIRDAWMDYERMMMENGTRFFIRTDSVLANVAGDSAFEIIFKSKGNTVLDSLQHLKSIHNDKYVYFVKMDKSTQTRTLCLSDASGGVSVQVYDIAQFSTKILAVQLELDSPERYDHLFVLDDQLNLYKYRVARN